jgi:phage major head subunit gpT-like protein
MAVTDRSIFENASTTFKELAGNVFAGGTPPGVYKDFATVQSTDSRIVEHDVLEAMPVAREWVGAKQYGDAQAASTTLTLKSYEASFKIKRLDLLTDRTGIVGRRMATWLGDTAYIYDQIAHEVLFANPTGYDGVALFSASHPRGPAAANQSNTTTSALSFSTFETAMQTGASLRDANGRPLMISYNKLIVGPKLASLAREITGSNERLMAVDNSGAESGTRVAAATVPNQKGIQVFTGGSLDVVVDPRMPLGGTYDDYWYLIDTTRGASPICGYEFRSPEAVTQDRMEDTARFDSDEFKYSIECDVVFGAGVWQVAYAGIL